MQLRTRNPRFVVLGQLVLCLLALATTVRATDIDDDGIDDAFDVCCNTPPGVHVDDHGRPLGDFGGDLDGDLVPDCDVDLRDFRIFQNNMRGGLQSF